MDPLGSLESIEAGGGEDEGVALTLFELFEASVYVAADFDEGDVWTEGEDLGSAAGAGGADSASGGEGVERPVGVADPDVAGVGAFGDSGEGELRGYFCGEIFYFPGLMIPVAAQYPLALMCCTIFFDRLNKFAGRFCISQIDAQQVKTTVDEMGVIVNKTRQ